MENTSNIITQELSLVQEKNVSEYLKGKAAVFQKSMRKVILLMTCLSVMCLATLIAVLDSPMRLVIIVAYAALFGSAILSGIYIERSRAKRIQNEKISKVCEGEGIVVSQRPLAVKYRDTDGVLKVAKSMKQNDTEKRKIGERVRIVLEDGKLVSCR